MLAARLHGAGDVRLHDEPLPHPRPDLHRVRVTAVGICGSDLHWFSGGGIGDAVLTYPLVVGHEFGGVIEGGPRDGERVAIEPARPCWNCPACHAGNHNLCPNVRFAGHGRNDGGMREYVDWEEEALFTVPDSLDDAEVALLEPLGVAIHAWDLGHHRVGEAVAVVGCGPIGLCTVQLARAAGATTIVAVEPLEHRREAARRAGATHVFAPGDEGLAGCRHRVPVVIEFAGNDEAVAESCELADYGGRVVLGGIPEEDHTTFPASTARRKGLTLALARRMKHVYPRAIALAASGAVELGWLATHSFALADAATAFSTAARREGLKVVVRPTAQEG